MTLTPACNGSVWSQNSRVYIDFIEDHMQHSFFCPLWLFQEWKLRFIRTVHLIMNNWFFIIHMQQIICVYPQMIASAVGTVNMFYFKVENSIMLFFWIIISKKTRMNQILAIFCDVSDENFITVNSLSSSAVKYSFTLYFSFRIWQKIVSVKVEVRDPLVQISEMWRFVPEQVISLAKIVTELLRTCYFFPYSS